VNPDLLNPNPDPDLAFQVNPETDPDQSGSKLQQKCFSVFDHKLQFTYVQATREAFSLQKRTSSTSKSEIY
jgi:hypothetical protein